MDNGEGTADCECPACDGDAITSTTQPVCDDKGMSHISDCYLKRYSCQQNEKRSLVPAKQCSKLNFNKVHPGNKTILTLNLYTSIHKLKGVCIQFFLI